MTKSNNLEIISVFKEENFAVLETEDGEQIDMSLDYLPDNLQEGRFLKFVINHCDYNPDKESSVKFRRHETKEKMFLVNGKQLSY